MAPPNRLAAVLPDRWRLAYDEEDQGLAKGFHGTGFDDSSTCCHTTRPGLCT